MENQLGREVLKVDYMRTIGDEFNKTVHCYLNFLYEVTHKYCINKDTNNKEINKRKFAEVRKRLFEFVKQHKGLFVLKIFRFMVDTSDGTVMSELNFPNVDSADKFIDFDKFMKFVVELTELFKNSLSVEKQLTVGVYDPLAYVKFLEQKLKKPMVEVTNEDMLNFKNIPFLDDQKWKNTKCSYAELREKITRRRQHFENNIISPERIEELSFIVDETTEHIVAEKECTICKEDYENSQVLCRMPCNHFFHRHCIANWFKLSNGHSEDSDSEDSNSSGGSIYEIPEYEIEDDGIPEIDMEEDEILKNDKEEDEVPANEMEDDGIPDYEMEEDGVPECDIEEDEILENDKEEDEIPANEIEDDGIPDYEMEEYGIHQYDIEEDGIHQYNIEENGIPEYEIEEDEIPEYDIEDDVPDTPKFQCPNCRHNFC